METELLYLADRSIRCKSRITDLFEDGVPVVRLDKTVMYPNTGSQRGDRGSIGSSRVLAVEISEGAIDHYVDHIEGLKCGNDVDVIVDEPWRKLQSSYHSAGHLLVYAADWIVPELKLITAQHWPDHAVTAFHSFRPITMQEERCINKFVGELIDAELPIKYDLKGRRHVYIGEFRGIPCNGTHLNSTNELARFRISGSSYSENVVEIRYLAHQR